MGGEKIKTSSFFLPHAHILIINPTHKRNSKRSWFYQPFSLQLSFATVTSGQREGSAAGIDGDGLSCFERGRWVISFMFIHAITDNPFRRERLSYMDLFGRYLFKQALGATLMVASTLTSIVWIATALKQLSLITSKGQSFPIFFKVTSLAIPNVTALILPIALLIASVHTFNRLNNDSELIVMTAAGARQSYFLKPLLVLALLVTAFIALVNFYIQPKSVRVLQEYIVQIRADLISTILQPGQFSSPERGITFHLRDRDENGDLLGLLVHDQRDSKQVITYLAERGRVIKSDGAPYLIMVKGHVQRQDRKSLEVQTVTFDQYVFDLSSFSKREGKVSLGPRARYLPELLYPAPDDKLYHRAPGRFRAELHQRFSSLLYPFVFVFVVVLYLGHARTTRQGRVSSLLSAFGISAITRVAGLSVTNLAVTHGWAVWLMYGIPMSVILIAALLITSNIKHGWLARLFGS